MARGLGLVLILAALGLGLLDWRESGGQLSTLHLRSIGTLWAEMNPASLSDARAWVEAMFPDWLWDPAITTALLIPLAPLLLGLGLMMVIRRKRRRRRYR
ncbi:hypothetical protein FDP22_05960 [Paroceanicella profunda]|uniref:Uncharacterized protein n=1 Tax=Paroceanicella profunda TaxID=2579971 RepID=A0A5B8FYU6_9RHOB|nr:hypothetical protein [Paroceanicella profunda]QDL91373.1 hypothetical protein FDP22_05960 [Paroceanicella profunda]